MIKNTLKTEAVMVKATTLPPTQPKELTPKEQSELKELEAAIAKSSAAKFDLAAALGTICKDKLYLAQYETFEEYCKKRWKISRSYGHRYLTLDEVMTDLKKVTEAAKVLPPNEGQARHYGNLDTNERKELLKKVCSESNGKGSSSRLILKWKNELFPEKCAAKVKPVAANSTSSEDKLLQAKAVIMKVYKYTVEHFGILNDKGVDDESTDFLLKVIGDLYEPIREEMEKEEEEADKAAKETVEEAA